MADIPDRSGPDEDPWLTVQQVSEELKINPATVRAWIRQARLPAVRPGKAFLVRRSDVDRALHAKAPPRAPDTGAQSVGEAELAASPRPAPRQIADHIIAVTPVAREHS
jgi:excisionase family DNA binding protein